MGFKQRERKRKAKAAKQGCQHEARESGSSAGKHWLTVVTDRCCCNDCAGILATGRECVYRRTPREILCVRCAQRQSISYRPSLQWEKRSLRYLR